MVIISLVAIFVLNARWVSVYNKDGHSKDIRNPTKVVHTPEQHTVCPLYRVVSCTYSCGLGTVFQWVVCPLPLDHLFPVAWRSLFSWVPGSFPMKSCRARWIRAEPNDWLAACRDFFGCTPRTSHIHTHTHTHTATTPPGMGWMRCEWWKRGVYFILDNMDTTHRGGPSRQADFFQCCSTTAWNQDAHHRTLYRRGHLDTTHVILSLRA